MLDNAELIQKWQGQLEIVKDGEKVSEPLGRFLRLLHYTVVAMVETETEPLMAQMFVKLAETLLRQTPYSKMLPGLASMLMASLVEGLK